MLFCFRFYIYYTYYCLYSSNFNVSFHIILLLCVFQNYFFYFIPGTGVNGLAGVGCYLHPGNKPIRLQDSCCIRNKCVYAKPHYLNKNLKSWIFVAWKQNKMCLVVRGIRVCFETNDSFEISPLFHLHSFSLPPPTFGSTPTTCQLLSGPFSRFYVWTFWELLKKYIKVKTNYNEDPSNQSNISKVTCRFI